MNAIEFKRKDRKINEADRFPAAYNGLVAGSSPTADRARTAGGRSGDWAPSCQIACFSMQAGAVELLD